MGRTTIGKKGGVREGIETKEGWFGIVSLAIGFIDFGSNDSDDSKIRSRKGFLCLERNKAFWAK